ncbi:21063_t:CDS:2, partial [Gigaspora rosea]
MHNLELFESFFETIKDDYENGGPQLQASLEKLAERETIPFGSEEAQSNLHIEEAVTSSNVKTSNTSTKNLKERNIASVTPVMNRKENRREFLEALVPSRNTNAINIIANDFNTNLNSTNVRISQAQNHYDPTRNKLAELIEGFIDTICQQNKALIKEISLQEVMDTIDKFPNYKAPGLDGIIYEFYKAYHEEVSPILKEVFNKALGL